MKRIVIGLGGNALVRRGEKPDAGVQLDHIARVAPGLAQVAKEWELVVVHGNGPQVGMLARESGQDPALTVTYPLDALVAETQGLLGYWLQQSIANEHDGALHGVEAVVDKDHVAALIAIALHADLLVILTDVPAVIADYGTPNARPLHNVTTDQLDAQHFAAGSMGPKVAAARDYAHATGNVAVIGALDQIADVIAGTAGTRITARQVATEPTTTEAARCNSR